MEFVYALPLLMLPFLLPLATGLMAVSFGRHFWVWFCISIPLPFIANILLLCLRDKSGRNAMKLRPVESEEIFDHLFVNKSKRFSRSGRQVTGVIIRSVNKQKSIVQH